MFANSKRAALGMAVLSAGASVPAGAAVATGAPAPVRSCVTRGLTAAEVARGERSVVHCATTRDEARAAALGEDMTAMGAGAVTAQAGFITAGFLFRSDKLDDVPLEIVGSDCGVQLRNIQPPWRDDISGFQLINCSTIKLFAGDQLDGESKSFARDRNQPYARVGLGPLPINNRVHSVAFKA